jgi:hypothetical protein
MAPADPAVLTEAVQRSLLRAKYAEQVDRDSAYERLTARLQKAPAADEPDPAAPRTKRSRPRPTRPRAPRPEKSTAERVIESGAFRQMARSAAAVVGREIARSIFGTGRR